MVSLSRDHSFLLAFGILTFLSLAKFCLSSFLTCLLVLHSALLSAVPGLFLDRGRWFNLFVFPLSSHLQKTPLLTTYEQPSGSCIYFYMRSRSGEQNLRLSAESAIITLKRSLAHWFSHRTCSFFSCYFIFTPNSASSIIRLPSSRSTLNSYLCHR